MEPYVRLFKFFVYLALPLLVAVSPLKTSYASDQTLTPFLKEALAERIIGSDKAKLTVVEYFSFTCPACGRFHIHVYPKLKEKYVDTGLVKFEFRDFPLDQWALRASALARCVPSKFYEPMVSVLMKQQSIWAGSEDVGAALLKLGQLAGLNEEKARKCMDDTQLLDGIIKARMEGNQKYGIDTTPSFLIGGKRIKAFEFEKLDKAIQRELK
tara:strand:- start:480 stop:1115 length:636 start_codon:yes stop_codon:yes gene_type:complete